MAVDGEDKPEQQVGKLDVADSALIKHEHHAGEADLQQEQPQQQQVDTVQVRMSQADAEVDPMQNGHPADLGAGCGLLHLVKSEPAALKAVSTSLGEYFAQEPNELPTDSNSITTMGGLAHAAAHFGLANAMGNGEYPMSSRMAAGIHPNHVQAAVPMVAVGPVASAVKHEDASHQAPGLGFQSEDASHRALGLGFQRENASHQAPGLGFQSDASHGGLGFESDDSPMSDVDVVDLHNAYVKPERKPLLRHVSGSRGGGEMGQAAKMGVDVQDRPASPAAHANGSEFGEISAFRVLWKYCIAFGLLQILTGIRASLSCVCVRMHSVFGMLPSILPVQASPINGLFSCVVAGSELQQQNQLFMQVPLGYTVLVDTVMWLSCQSTC